MEPIGHSASNEEFASRILEVVVNYSDHAVIQGSFIALRVRYETPSGKLSAASSAFSHRLIKLGVRAFRSGDQNAFQVGELRQALSPIAKR